MKTGSFFFFMFLINLSVLAQEVKEKDAWKYMHMLSADELTNRAEIGKYFQATAPPSSPVESLAEFEPMSGTLIAFPFGIPTDLIQALAAFDTLYTLVNTPETEQQVKQYYSNMSIDLKRCKFIVVKRDTYWTRDYSPIFIAGKDSIGVVDFIYNRNRPNDDIVPQAIASKYKFPFYSMDIIHTGGNYMSDGNGIAASSKLVYSENTDKSKEQVDQKMKDYLGIKTYYTLDDPNNTYIDHIDCWGKFLDVDKILIRSVPVTHSRYSAIEAVAEFFKNQKSSWGNNYQVFRVYTPNDEPYTNSFILNNRVFVPIIRGSNDTPALESYRNAMPGYQVSGYTGNWGSTDALHCRVHEMADKQMLRIKHTPVKGAQGNKTSFTFEADIKAYSGKPLYNDSVLVYYKTDFSPWQSVKMIQQNGNKYAVTLSVEKEKTVQYYIYAVDQSGKKASQPLVGKAAPYAFSTSDTFTGSDSGLAEAQVKVYPNPVNNWLNISVRKSDPMGNYIVEIYSMNGLKIASYNEINDGLRIPMSGYPKGLYLVKVHSGTNQQSFKVVKQ